MAWGKSTLVQYAAREVDGIRFVVYRDQLEQFETQACFRSHIGMGDRGYTEERLAVINNYLKKRTDRFRWLGVSMEAKPKRRLD